MLVVIIDYQICNLGSVKRAFEECGAEVIISSNPSDLDRATHVVLPGVGAFPTAIKNLKKLGFIESIKKTALQDKIPFMGICLGMQLLADKGFEIEETDGLGLVHGQIIKLSSKGKNTRVPHIGWNELDINCKDSIFDTISDKTDFYFVHSYHFVPKEKNQVISYTPYCDGFVSAIKKDNILGFQFHPEKSSTAGFRLIKNFLSY
ncbi:imidazole glycerol phosphate synthase subunit HisH [bacterium]|jgi:imidazole glycerol-phosphate synthase subunit HisH|nr:imidazole glycerol phosphate synthase subunit HisH [bacterium]